MMTDVRFWDRLARRYAASPVKNMTAYEATLARVAARLRPTDRVLETGCGTGTTALKLAGQVAAYTGTDVSGGMIEIARERLAETPVDGLDFTVAGAVETRFEPESFDAVLGFNLLHLVDDLTAALDRAHALLAPGGLYITKTPCLGDMGWYIRPMIPLLRLFGKAPHVLFFTRSELERAMIRAGFELDESRVFEGAPHVRYLVARKA